ncbi:hypothetical protein B1992_02470 [Pseudoxanthomonas broegbernensis]|uniref:DUF3247 family protein n=1 Tax=Pseudoxanthomonas broegbernensis TaxID=83619 RepID=A0A7V8GPA2_9GAMM|nr:DUF3247 family protein [Pseudoxanthomonas broegbernensis]KAF1687549.1 hypothetical protein B1992_02470 [Pseudoxanthomonas broegbernensis]MBB6064559.1 hypothetical protein [Pseudoxanthomonas broegbernensis]
MNASPERLLTTRAGIDRLTALCTALDDEEQVRLRFDDGLVLDGVVAARPTVQVFRDGDGQEGFNALLRLEPLAGDHPSRYLWLDRLVEVVRLGSA